MECWNKKKQWTNTVYQTNVIGQNQKDSVFLMYVHVALALDCELFSRKFMSNLQGFF